MPMITVEGPKIKDIDLKRKLVKKLYDAAFEIYKIDEIIVLIKENSPENVGVNGKLVCD
ncbi:tautomerase family protein [bacterium]|nr:tautomerase family protein [candidate division CSSED10-310 bacterium]